MNRAEPASGSPPDLSALFREGRHAELEQATLALLSLHPDNGFLWKALGVAQAALGKKDEALVAKGRAARLSPGDSEAHSNFGNALLGAHRFDEAEAAFRKALRIDPRSVTAWTGLGQLAGAQWRMDEAESNLRRVIALAPESHDARNNLGNLLREAGRMREAAACYRRALALRPRFAEAQCNLANTLADLGQANEAEHWYRQALALAPGNAVIHSNFGNLLKDHGRLAEAQAAYSTAVALDPRFAGAHSNLLLAMNHNPELPVQQGLDEARRFGQLAAARAASPLAKPNAIASALGRPLRVGMVSGDLRNHPVGYFLEGLVANLDPAQVRLSAYSTVPREDDLTARIKPRFAQWRRIDGLDDEAAARLIFADSPDVLLDLSGHTAHNRLGVFAWRPAPVQAGWLGYFATTGLAAMDWVIADRASVQEAQHAHFTERIWYLPQTRLCFTPPDQAPVAGPLPAQANGFVTFGSFQNLGKVNEQVLALWSRVLEAVPGSRLRWQNALLADEATRDLVRRRMAARGIEPSRLRFQGKVSRRAYLAAYNEIDIVLDSFPYPGGTTTCEALWMGVPTVTLQGDRMLSRQGAALLAAAGVPQWIAGDQEEYVANAAALAGDLPALAELRRTLRERVATSALFDARRFAREFAQALHSMASATPAP